jgi:hypothetical protein
MWWNGCTDVGYHCGTLVDQYKLNHTFPNCPTNPVGLPAGECIYQNGSCIWSTCHPWLGYCESYWLCGSEYDLQLYLNLPYPPCPPPPTNHTPPPEPGVCRYNLTSNRCEYDLSINPCATLKCPNYAICRVYSPTGEGYCDPTCYFFNGGCKSNEQCSVVPVNCIKAPCPSVIKCSKSDYPANAVSSLESRKSKLSLTIDSISTVDNYHQYSQDSGILVIVSSIIIPSIVILILIMGALIIIIIISVKLYNKQQHFDKQYEEKSFD